MRAKAKELLVPRLLPGNTLSSRLCLAVDFFTNSTSSVPRSIRREETEARLGHANAKKTGMVELKHRDCSATRGGLADDALTIPAKMCAPAVRPWIEQRCFVPSFWVNRGNAIRLVEITARTCESQVFSGGGTATGLWDDVLKVGGASL